MLLENSQHFSLVFQRKKKRDECSYTSKVCSLQQIKEHFSWWNRVCKALQSKTEFREMIIIQEKHVIFNPVKTIKFLSFTVLSDHSYVYSSSTNVTFNFRGNNYVLPFVEQKNDFSLYTYKWETHNKIDMTHYQYLIGALCGVFISFYSNFRICMCKNA